MRTPSTLVTERLRLRELTTDDATFMLGLLNQPSFLEFVGDRGVRTEAQARDYLSKGPVASFDAHGFGFFLVERQEDQVAIGICGLVDRPGLDDIDIGFALLPEFWRMGYAYEAASAVLHHARTALGLDRIVAITSISNEASGALLEKLGLRFERKIRLPGDPEELNLFATRTLHDRPPTTRGTPS